MTDRCLRRFGILGLTTALLAAARLAAQVTGASGVVGLDGRAADPLRVPPGVHAHVLVFTTTDCPISNRYAPEIARLASVHAPRGVRFWMVYPVPDDTPERIRGHVGRFGLDLPVVRDTAHALIARTGVTVTPEVAVIDGRGTMVYRGRIDDRYVDFGVDRPAPTSRDLERSLTNLLAGRPVEPRVTPAVGCYLPELLK